MLRPVGGANLHRLADTMFARHSVIRSGNVRSCGLSPKLEIQDNCLSGIRIGKRKRSPMIRCYYRLCPTSLC